MPHLSEDRDAHGAADVAQPVRGRGPEDGLVEELVVEPARVEEGEG